MSQTNVKTLLEELKDLSSLMLDLAYSSVFFKNREIAEEVLLLHDKLENLEEELYMHLFAASRGVYNKKLVSLIDIVESTKSVANAARNLAELIIDGKELHPVIKEAISASDDIVARTVIDENSDAIGKTLKELKVGEDLGVDVIAIRRKEGKGYKWIFGPKLAIVLKAKDTIVIVGHKKVCHKFKKLL